MYGHVEAMAKAEAEGIKAAGGSVDLYRVEETLPEEVLSKMHAPAKSGDIPTLTDPKTLEQYDAFLFGIPTRYGNFPAQWKAFWDKTGGQWQTGALWVCRLSLCMMIRRRDTRADLQNYRASTLVCSCRPLPWAVDRRAPPLLP